MSINSGRKGHLGHITKNPSLVSGTEQIHEGGEDEEVGSSVLNDPSRANIAAIEMAKQKLESGHGANRAAAAPPGPAPSDTDGDGAPEARPTRDDGWPPAMSDPWGTGGGDATGRDRANNAPAPPPAL